MCSICTPKMDCNPCSGFADRPILQTERCLRLFARTEVVQGHEIRDGRRRLNADIGLRSPLDDFELCLVVEVEIDARLGDFQRQNIVIGASLSADSMPAICVHQCPLHALAAEFGASWEEHVVVVLGVRECVVDHALLVVELLFRLVNGIEVLRVLGVEEVFQDVGSEGNQEGQKKRIDVSDVSVLSYGPDGYGAGQLDEGPGLDGFPGNTSNDRNLGTLVRVDSNKKQSFPDFVSMEGTHSKVQEQSEEATGGNPGNDGKGTEGDKHEEGLSESRPALLFTVGDNLTFDAVLVGFDGSCAESTTMERSLGDEPVARGKSQEGTWEKGNAKDKEIPVVGIGFLEVELWRLRQDAGDVVVDDEEQEEHESRNQCAKNSLQSNSLKGVDHPCTVGCWLPVPWSDNIDALDGIALVNSGNVAEGSRKDDGNQSVVGGQKGSHLAGKENPVLSKMQSPGNVAGDQSDDK
mmetsp:Transcript_18373/g.42168  ORF Transcript_18373/g.42168 Transcript_18373/m.42168 type:complete len:465 (-) Transcript_18373:32-1426(-)